jgi:hypothetical protein
MLASVKQYLPKGKCVISGAEGEGVEVEFADGTVRGFLSLKEFARLLKARSAGNGRADAPLFQNPPEDQQ